MAWVDDAIKLLAIILPIVVVILVGKLILWLMKSEIPDEDLTEDKDARYRRLRAEDARRRREEWNDEYEELTGERVYSWEEFERRQHEQDSLQHTSEKFF